MWLTHKNNIVRGLVSKYNNIIAMEMRQAFSNFGSLKNDVLRVLIEPLRLLILILKWFHVFIQDHGAYKQFMEAIDVSNFNLSNINFVKNSF
jgi:hypothetical protein